MLLQRSRALIGTVAGLTNAYQHFDIGILTIIFGHESLEVCRRLLA
jgi:hypothetical protein